MLLLPLLTAVAAAGSTGSAHAPCEAPPKGMVCVPGGPAIVGADDRTPAEAPRHEVDVPTFYLDRDEVTNAAYARCEKAGACPSKWGRVAKSYGPFLGPTQPALPMSWDIAHAYCVWAGKRLPSEAECEKAARGGPEARRFPWGEDPPSCDKANFKGCEKTTKPVGSYAPGPYGVRDLAGNGYEWVKDWATPCYDGCPNACGAACQGLDPRGPCGGAPSCKGRKERVLKGGSWYWDGEIGRGSWRRAQYPESGMHRLSFRCASTTPALSTWPPLARTDELPQPPDPEPPTAEELAKFRDVVEDTDILEIKPCKRQGEANPDCRDPMSYIKTNETGHHVWLPYVENVGGGYVGLGADQSYSFVAAARSRWAWIFDYDPQVVRVHHVILAVVKEAETPHAFVSAFAPGRIAATRAAIRKHLEGDPAEQEATDRAFLQVRDDLWKHYFKSMGPTEWNKRFGWLRNAAYYRYVRLMVLQGRVQVLKGNMLTDKALPSIARSAKALGVPIRVYYPSNAEEQWVLPQQYKDNVRGFPFDERTVILRTLFSKKWGNKSQSYWHYVVHAGPHCQRLLGIPGFDTTHAFMDERRDTGLEMLSAIGLPARTEREPAAP